MSDYLLRRCTPADLPDIAALVADVLLQDLDEKNSVEWETVYEPDRRLAVLDGDKIVATTGALSRQLTVPGGQVPAAHVNAVVVAGTHRRRGLLTMLVTDQLRAVQALEHEPIAALWASEGGIYRRFGYGLASWKVELEVDTGETTIPAVAPAAHLTRGTPGELQTVLADVYDRARGLRPGVSTRAGPWWELRTREGLGADGGLSAERAVVVEGENGPEGYAIWRGRLDWGRTAPDGSLNVSEVTATSSRADVALWSYLLSTDLVRSVEFPLAAVDEPLLHLTTNPHAIAVSRRPGLWVRIVDPGRALAARRYASPIDIVIDVGDNLLPSNERRWHLVGDRRSSTCVATDAAPDLRLDISTLGSAYLGGVSLATLAAAGRVRELHAGAVQAAAVAFEWPIAPRPQETF